MTAQAPTQREHGNAYNIFIFVVTIVSLVIMVLLWMPVSAATKELLGAYDVCRRAQQAGCNTDKHEEACLGCPCALCEDGQGQHRAHRTRGADAVREQRRDALEKKQSAD